MAAIFLPFPSLPPRMLSLSPKGLGLGVAHILPSPSHKGHLLGAESRIFWLSARLSLLGSACWVLGSRD